MLSPQRECYEHTNMGDKRKKKRRILSSIATKPMSLHSTIKDSPITHGYLFVSRKAHMPYGAGARSQHNITINDWDLHWIWFMYVYNSHRALFTHKHISVGLLYYVVTCYNESVLALLCFFFLLLLLATTNRTCARGDEPILFRSIHERSRRFFFCVTNID